MNDMSLTIDENKARLVVWGKGWADSDTDSGAGDYSPDYSEVDPQTGDVRVDYIESITFRITDNPRSVHVQSTFDKWGNWGYEYGQEKREFEPDEPLKYFHVIADWALGKAPSGSSSEYVTHLCRFYIKPKEGADSEYRQIFEGQAVPSDYAGEYTIKAVCISRTLSPNGVSATADINVPAVVIDISAIVDVPTVGYTYENHEIRFDGNANDTSMPTRNADDVEHMREAPYSGAWFKASLVFEINNGERLVFKELWNEEPGSEAWETFCKYGSYYWRTEPTNIGYGVTLRHSPIGRTKKLIFDLREIKSISANLLRNVPDEYAVDINLSWYPYINNIYFAVIGIVDRIGITQYINPQRRFTHDENPLEIVLNQGKVILFSVGIENGNAQWNENLYASEVEILPSVLEEVIESDLIDFPILNHNHTETMKRIRMRCRWANNTGMAIWDITERWGASRKPYIEDLDSGTGAVIIYVSNSLVPATAETRTLKYSVYESSQSLTETYRFLCGDRFNNLCWVSDSTTEPTKITLCNGLKTYTKASATTYSYVERYDASNASNLDDFSETRNIKITYKLNHHYNSSGKIVDYGNSWKTEITEEKEEIYAAGVMPIEIMKDYPSDTITEINAVYI